MLKLKAFAEDILNVVQMTDFVFDRVENFVSKKREIAGYNNLLPLYDVFKRLQPRLLKSGVLW